MGFRKKLYKTKKRLDMHGPRRIVCSEKKGCGIEKDRSEFTVHKQGNSGFKYSDTCRECKRKKHNSRKIPKRYIKKAGENYRKKNPEKVMAHKEMHHPDYDHPEKVIFLCKPHHTDLHLNRLDEVDQSIVAAKVMELFDVR
jgi:hypothetical protein